MEVNRGNEMHTDKQYIRDMQENISGLDNRIKKPKKYKKKNWSQESRTRINHKKKIN